MAPATMEIGLSDAAHELGLSYNSARDLLLTHQLEGRKDGKRWKVTRASLDAYQRKALAVA